MSESTECLIYARISDDPRGNHAGVERQQRECRDLAESKGWTVVDVIVDNDASATTGKPREGFERLLAARPERVVVWATDRLVRVAKDLERVLDLGLEVHSCVSGEVDLSNPTGRAMARVAVAFSTLEGEQKAERQRAQHRQRVEQGKPWGWGSTNGRMPFGYALSDEGSIVLDETEAPLLEEAYREVASGATYAEVARRWAGQGLTYVGRERCQHESGSCPGGHEVEKQPHGQWLRQLMHSPRNAALIATEDEGEYVPGAWPAIVDADMWKAALGVAGNLNLRGKGSGKRQGLLTGIVQCGVCDKTLRLRWRTNRQGVKQYRVYASECSHVSVPQEWLEEYLEGRIVDALSEPLALGQHWQWPGEPRPGAEATETARQINALRERMTEAADSYALGEIDRATLAKVNQRVRESLEPLEAQLARSYAGSPMFGGEAPTSREEMLTRWQDGTQDERRALVRHLLREVSVKQRKRGEAMTKEALTLRWRWRLVPIDYTMPDDLSPDLV
ncbi:recombinase family protein [Serinicoccus sp. LYQ131]|uniref:recombinase family protein n=1 Tax=Serinicoccus sp. LYQ131 TaxID=3378797 RepID=UPI0038549A82